MGSPKGEPWDFREGYQGEIYLQQTQTATNNTLTSGLIAYGSMGLGPTGPMHMGLVSWAQDGSL